MSSGLAAPRWLSTVAAMVAGALITVLVMIWHFGASLPDLGRRVPASADSFTPADLKKLDRDIVAYQSFAELQKMYLPVVAGAAVTILGGLGYYLVQARTAEAQTKIQEQLERHLRDSTDAVRSEYERATTEMEALKASVSKRIEEEMADHMEVLQYRLSVAFYELNQIDSAISLGRRARELTTKLADSIRKDQEPHIWSVQCDLAYYLALRYQRDRSQRDKDEALALIRVVDDIHSRPAFHRLGDQQRAGLIDNYLFVVSRVESTGGRDRRLFIELFEQEKAAVQDHLRRANPVKAEEIYQSYEAFTRRLAASPL
jgi:hypothetical protein